ncbi:hypothetical protein RRG08_009087 [Elysia crispata]|uniref:ACB domain-containing protein n=1 Tax=Elysia crispata TaxID=231223 RepID=A0AAE1CTX2_9GAST|nr:hypothetical protein RRG08_009087 [Elysia crispata]
MVHELLQQCDPQAVVVKGKATGRRNGSRTIPPIGFRSASSLLKLSQAAAGEDDKNKDRAQLTIVFMATSPRDKFDAAVKVIRGLPKNGAFQPSHELMLKFYSYFKQATEGPCRSPKPGFWDVVNRKKWDAWAKLGSMEAEEAMLLYVDELKKIVETMPQTDDVSEFLQKLDNFYEMVEDSDNHNSLKVYNKEASQGNSSGTGNFDQPFDQSFNDPSHFDSELEHSQGITKLLQQDISWWQDRTAIPRAHKANGDIRPEGQKDVSRQTLNVNPDLQKAGNGNSENQANEFVADHPDLLSVPEGEANHPDTPGTPGTEEEWEEVEARASNSGSHSGQSGGSISDSETENEEEFCDTSDEPAETIHPQDASTVLPHYEQTTQVVTFTPVSSAVAVINTNKLVSSTSATSTAMAKSVHFDEHDGAMTSKIVLQKSSSPLTSTRGVVSDSLLVNHSPQTGNLMDITSANLSEGCLEVSSVGNQTMMWDSSYDAGVGTSSQMDISVCRGGEGDEGDRNKQARTGSGGHFGRDGLPPGRGGSDLSSGVGGSGSRRGLFPGPGGGGGGGRGGPGMATDDRSPADLNEQIVVTLLRLQHDMSGVLNRLNSLEALVKEGRAEREKKAKATRGWWPLSELSFKSALIIFGWPLLIQLILFCINRRKRRHMS